MTVTKRGGIRFIRIGRVQMTWSIARHKACWLDEAENVSLALIYGTLGCAVAFIAFG